MQIFEEERAFANLMSDDKAIASFNVKLKNIPDNHIQKILDHSKSNALAHYKDKDLFHVPTVLVSVGCNDNDDVFTKEETWKSRKTPEDKPFNLEHNEADIIGHIINNYVVDENFDVIADDTSIDQLPNKFHIITPSVIYTHWRNDKLKERSDNLIAEIGEGIWCVSMEAHFTDFGYMVFEEDESYRAVGRSQETAYLTKYLRAYGGSGKYDGKKIARVLKNITFSGKGLVKNPANPESVILNGSEKNTSKAEVGVLNTKTNDSEIKTQGEIMANENQDKEIAELKAKVELLSTERDEAKAKAAQSAEQLVKDKIGSLEASIKVRDDSITELKTKIESLEKDSVASKKLADEAVANLDKASKELEAIKVEKVKAERIVSLEKLGFATTEATEKYEKFAALSNEMFAEVVASLAALKPTETKKVDATAKKDEKVLESAKADKEPPLNDVNSDNEDTNKDVVAAISNRIGELFKKNRKNKKSVRNDEEGDN
jgi:hypothetical protein